MDLGCKIILHDSHKWLSLPSMINGLPREMVHIFLRFHWVYDFFYLHCLFVPSLAETVRTETHPPFSGKVFKES